MLKKSLIALAIASVAGSAFAVELTAPENFLSIQGARGVTEATKINHLGLDDVTAGELRATLNAEYKVDDIITLEFSGAKLVDADKVTTTVTLKKFVKEGEGEDAKLIENDGGKPVGSMTLGLLEASDSSITFRVTDLTFEPNIDGIPVEAALRKTAGGIAVFKNIQLNTADILASGQAKVTYKARTSDNSFSLDRVDGKDVETVLFRAKNQFEANVATVDGKLQQFTGTVDVNKERVEFVDGKTSTVKLQVLDLNATGDDKGKFARPANATKVEFTVPGQFGFMIDEFNDDGSHKKLAGDAAAGDAKVFADRLEFEGAAFDDGVSAKEVELTVPGDQVIPHQRFTAATAKVTYATGDLPLPITNVGEWKLNGAVYHIPFVPFTAGFSPLVNVSNTSNQTGDISVVIYPQNSASWEVRNEVLSIPAKAKAQTDITSALRALNIQGNVALDIIVNAPSDEIDVNALYFSNGDRAVIRAQKRNEN